MRLGILNGFVGGQGTRAASPEVVDLSVFNVNGSSITAGYPASFTTTANSNDGVNVVLPATTNVRTLAGIAVAHIPNNQPGIVRAFGYMSNCAIFATGTSVTNAADVAMGPGAASLGVNSTGLVTAYGPVVMADQSGLSLPGLARENIVDAALAQNADYVLFYDDDMVFGSDLFLRLLMDDVPIVAALAFTSREPITPVIYKFTPDGEEIVSGKLVKTVNSRPTDYIPNALQQVDGVGSGVMLIKTEVFKTIPKPWFNSTGCGEDIHFCIRALQYNVPVYVDTRAKTIHKPAGIKVWHDEQEWLRRKEGRVANVA